jgi:hypothetical protein
VKKVLLLVSALLIVFSGVAAVSAYEGHLVDVKAHVENALMVEIDELDFGTVFPQQYRQEEFYIGLSQSFRDQEYYTSVIYKLYWEAKPADHVANYTPYVNPNNPNYYIPIYPYITTKVDGDSTNVTPVVGYPLLMEIVDNAGVPLTLDHTDPCDEIHFLLEPPVFDKWYNEMTDQANGRTGRVIYEPDYYTTTENITCNGDTWYDEVPHTDLGSNFKIQVVSIVH